MRRRYLSTHGVKGEQDGSTNYIFCLQHVDVAAAAGVGVSGGLRKSRLQISDRLLPQTIHWYLSSGWW